MPTSIRIRAFGVIACMLIAQFIGAPALGACDPDAWYGHREIVVPAGIVSGPIVAGNGSDSVLVEAGAQVVASGREATGIDAGNGADLVVNEGTILVSASESQAIPVGDAGSCEGHDDTWWAQGMAPVTAIGIQAGNGKDTVQNLGSIQVEADASVSNAGKAASLAIGVDAGNGKDSCETLDSTLASEGAGASLSVSAQSSAAVADASWELADWRDADQSVGAEAAAIGILGGNGKDLIANSGGLEVDAVADIDFSGISASILSLRQAELSLEAQSLAVGIDGGRGRDEVANSGDIQVGARSSIDSASLTVSGLSLTVPYRSAFDSSATATARAVGIQAGSACGDDLDLSSASSLAVRAEASIVSLSATISLVDAFQSADTSLAALAEATGISGGSGRDELSSSGSTSVSADSRLESWAAKLTGLSLASGDFGGLSVAEATGISSGHGEDTIENRGLILSDASAEALVNSFSLILVDFSPALGWFGDEEEADAEASLKVQAHAAGISSGSQDDEVRNSGDIEVLASAESTRLGLQVSAEGLPDNPEGFLSLGNLADLGTSTLATAIGLDGGSGDDELASIGDIVVSSSALALGGSLGLGLPLVELPINSPLPAFSMVSAGNEARSTAAGMQGGEGDDDIINAGAIDVDASAGALNATASIAYVGGVDKFTIAATRVDALTEAEAAATGIDSGEDDRCAQGDDSVANAGALTVNALAEAMSIAANVSVQTKVEGAKTVDIQGLLANVGSSATSGAIGIASGDGDDLVVNSGAIAATALSRNAGVGLSLGIVGNGESGFVLDGALVKADTLALANSAGIAGGEGDDSIFNRGNVEVDATSQALSAALALTIHGSNSKALSLQAAVASTSSVSGTMAEGLSGGGGDDSIVNKGALDVSADAQSYAASIAADISLGKQPGLGLALANAQNEATASALGMAGGDGDDYLENRGTLRVGAQATAVAASIAITRQGAAGAGTLDPLSFDTGNVADASAAGMEGGAGNDTILNSGALDVSATAIAPSLGVAISGKGVSLGICSADALARAVGIDSGSGDDALANSGDIVARAFANADALSVDIAGTGAALSANDVWDGGVEARALAKGIDLGAGNNALSNSGDLEAEATAISLSAGVAIVGKGLSSAISTASVMAEAIGIDPGASTLALNNSGDISSVASATAGTLNASITGQGVAAALDQVWDGGTGATAVASGIRSGSADNDVRNSGAIAAQATATTVSLGVAIAGQGLSLATTSSSAQAEATGLDSGAGNDRIENSGAISADAASIGVSVAAAISGVGVSGAAGAVWDGGSKSSALAAGIRAGSGDDELANSGEIGASSTATTVAADLTITGTGVALATSTASTSAKALGIDAGDGGDRILNEGGIETDADATGVAVAASITGIGVSAASDAVWDGGTKTDALALGIAAGTGDDFLSNVGIVDAAARATTVAVDLAVTVKGVALAANTSTTSAQALALDGGEGIDRIVNEGELSASASANGVGVAASLAGIGASGATDSVWSNGTMASAAATGIYGGDGADAVWNSARIYVEASANAAGVDLALTGIGLGAALSKTTVETRASGLDGGEGDDVLFNSGAIEGSSQAKSVGVGISLAGIGVGASGTDFWDNGIEATALFAGIDGGSGRDGIDNRGTITGSALAETPAVSVALSGIGIGAALNNSTAVAAAAGLDGGEGDDAISNSGGIESSATARADTVAVTVTGIGAGFAGQQWSQNTLASASASGIEGGSGNDNIRNEARIDATASSTSGANSVAITLAGYASAAARNESIASASGIRGGDGDDAIANSGDITTRANASTTARSLSVNLVGAAPADAASLAEANAAGLEGGSGRDLVENVGDLDIAATATAYANSAGIVLAGAGAANAEVVASASTLGLSGGDGADTLVNRGEVALLSEAVANVGSVSVGLAGAFGSQAGTQAIARSTGMDGGAGDDLLRNEAEIDVKSAGSGSATSTSVGIAGSAKADADTEAQAIAQGMAGGEGNDTIDNRGAIKVQADAELSLSGFSFNLAGAASSQGGLSAIGEALGLAAGSGDDAMDNAGDLTVGAIATVRASGSSNVAFGAASAGSGSSAGASAAGMAAGAGNDIVDNDGAITVTANSTMSLDGSAFSFGGTAGSGQGSMSADSSAVGISGGEGDDTIRSAGLIDIHGTATLGAASASSAAFGLASSGSSLIANVDAYGISGGSGDDTLTNAGGILIGSALDPGAASAISLSSTSWTFIGSGVGSATGLASTLAIGISGAEGADIIQNGARLDIYAQSGASSTSGAYAFIGNADSSSGIAAEVNAGGLDGGEGADILSNASSILVEARAGATSDASSYAFGATLKAGADASAISNATGIEAGKDDDAIDNAGTVVAKAFALASADAKADTNFGVNAGTAQARANAVASGIDAGSGSDSIFNRRGASVRAEAAIETQSANVNARSDEAATARDYATVLAVGIESGEGANAIYNEGDIVANARTLGSAFAKASSTSSRATAIATYESTVEAYGVRSGDGNDLIENGALGKIVAESSAQGGATARYIDAHLDEAVATSIQIANAYGIRSGAGFDTVVNRGSIEATASASASASASAATWFASNYSTATATAKAQAIGIELSGSGEIENFGCIKATAGALNSADASGQHKSTIPTSTALSVGIQALSGNNTIINYGSIVSQASVSGGGTLDAQAYGIQTGGGDDTIYNYGSIRTTRIINGSASGGTPIGRALAEGAAGDGFTADGSTALKGVGISTGAGDDVVILGDGSYIGCTLELGEGDDGLTVIGSGSISGEVFGGEGNDLITLDGATDFSLANTFDFEGLAKLGAGSVSIGDARFLESLEVLEGELRIEGGYQFGETGKFSAWVYGDGEAGRLEVVGGLGLDGTMSVSKGDGYFRDGASFLVLSADALSGAFDTIILPEDSALLRFTASESDGSGILVNAEAEAFATVADSALGRSVSGCLDSIAEDAEGDLSRLLGEIQGLPRAAIADAYESLSPAAYAPSSLSSLAILDLFGRALGARLDSLRLGAPAASGTSPAPIGIKRLGYSSAAKGNGAGRTPEDGLWIGSFGRWGSFAGDEGTGAFDQSLYGTSLGYDRLLGDFAAGLNLSYARSELAQAGAADDADALGASVYGAYRNRALHVESALTYGHQAARGERRVEVGSIDGVATSERSIDAFMASASSGLELGPRPWILEPLAALRYAISWEQGFTEEGAGAASLIIGERVDSACFSELGLRMGFALDLEGASLSARLSGLWRHDFSLESDGITAAFVEAPDESFAIAGAPNLGDGALIEAGLQFSAGAGLSLSLEYELELRGAYSASGLSASVRYGF